MLNQILVLLNYNCVKMIFWALVHFLVGSSVNISNREQSLVMKEIIINS